MRRQAVGKLHVLASASSRTRQVSLGRDSGRRFAYPIGRPSVQGQAELLRKQQAEAQRLHEERMKKRKEAEEARLALEKQREELLKKQQEEKAKLLKRLGEASGTTSEAEENGFAAAGDENASEQTKALRAQLAALEAEAKSLGIDPESGAQSFRGRGRGFGGYRGRGRGFAPAPRGAYRGSFRGRGAPRGAGRGGVLRLDNRPKRVAISGVDLNSEKDEALRQYLIVSFSSGLIVHKLSFVLIIS